MSADNFDPKVLGGSIQRGIVNPDLEEERAKCTFDQKELTLFLHGQKMIDEIEDVVAFQKKHPEVDDDFDYYEMSRAEKMEHWWKRFHTVMKDDEYHRFFTRHAERTGDVTFNWHYVYHGASPLHLHQSMFTKTLKFFASEKQKEEWLPKANHLQVIGCYAQTELGHGSNVQGLETTATFDLKNDQFVVHTPSIRATKFWPGSLGVMANHAIVFARCIVDESDYGVQPFIVQIRDMETHRAMPGIKVGDVGEKIGYSNVDNGFLSFEHYRIPRKALLARFMSITKTGDFKMKANPKIIYQIMVQTRLMIMFGASLNLSRASVVATRYAVCRRQFANVKGSSQERKLIDYQTHMDILAPNIAAGLCLNMAGREINEKIVKKSNKMIMEDDYKLLDVLHHFTSGLKALGGEMAYNGLDEMRQACGGAGFLTASGIASLWEDVAPYATYEGVNVVMFQQSARYLIKQRNKLEKGKECTEWFAYINDTPKLGSIKSEAQTSDEFLSWEHIERALATRSLFNIDQTYTVMKESKAPSKTKQNELFALNTDKMARAHLAYILFKMTKDRIDAYPFVDVKVKVPLQLLVKVYALKSLIKDSQPLYECGFFGAGSGLKLDDAYAKLLVELRPHMIPYVEYSENMTLGLRSTIGNEFGDIYETQLRVAKNSKLNKNEVPPYYEKYMKPTMAMRRPKI